MVATPRTGAFISRMPMRNKDPLVVAQEAALLLLSNMLLWIWSPLLVLIVAVQGREVLERPAMLLVLPAAPLAGWLLRPSPRRPARTRAVLAAWAIGLAVAIAVFMNGLRAVNVSGIALVLTLLLLVRGRRTMTAVLGVVVLMVLAGMLAVQLGVISRPIDEAVRPLAYQLAVLTLTVTGLGYCAAVTLSTIQVYGVARAVAEERLADLLEAQGEAELLQRREVQATIATGMAHDIANIVQVMTGTAELLKEQTLDDDGKQAVRDIEVVGEKATRTLRTLLAVGRGMAPDPAVAATGESTDMRALLPRLEVLLRPLVGRYITLSIDAHCTRLVQADGARIEQVLLNLAVNARDAMREGGTLRIGAEDDGEGVVITVADSGTGMPPEIQARMFEPYFTTKAKGKGTGLGLAMVQRIVAQLDGRITVESAPGAGTTFRVWLPVRPSSAPATPR